MIFAKMMNENRNDWDSKLDDALSACRAPTGMSLCQLVFGDTCDVPIELEHQTLCALRRLSFAYDEAVESLSLNFTYLMNLDWSISAQPCTKKR